jgi:hypothetical protein
VDDRHRPRQVGEEDEARLQRPDQQRLAAVVVGRDLAAELSDPRVDLVGREVDLTDALVEDQEARSSP